MQAVRVMTCYHCAGAERREAAARQEALEKQNAELIEIIRQMIKKRIGLIFRIDDETSLRPEALRELTDSLTHMAAIAVENMLQSRSALYREIAELRFNAQSGLSP